MQNLDQINLENSAVSVAVIQSVTAPIIIHLKCKISTYFEKKSTSEKNQLNIKVDFNIIIYIKII